MDNFDAETTVGDYHEMYGSSIIRLFEMHRSLTPNQLLTKESISVDSGYSAFEISRTLEVNISGFVLKNKFDALNKAEVSNIFKKNFIDNDQNEEVLDKIINFTDSLGFAFKRFPRSCLGQLSANEYLIGSSISKAPLKARKGLLKGRNLELAVASKSAAGFSTSNICDSLGVSKAKVVSIISYFNKYKELPCDRKGKYPTIRQLQDLIDSAYQSQKYSSISSWNMFVKNLKLQFPGIPNFSLPSTAPESISHIQKARLPKNAAVDDVVRGNLSLRYIQMILSQKFPVYFFGVMLVNGVDSSLVLLSTPYSPNFVVPSSQFKIYLLVLLDHKQIFAVQTTSHPPTPSVVAEFILKSTLNSQFPHSVVLFDSVSQYRRKEFLEKLHNKGIFTLHDNYSSQSNNPCKKFFFSLRAYIKRSCASNEIEIANSICRYILNYRCRVNWIFKSYYSQFVHQYQDQRLSDPSMKSKQKSIVITDRRLIKSDL